MGRFDSFPKVTVVATPRILATALAPQANPGCFTPVDQQAVVTENPRVAVRGVTALFFMDGVLDFRDWARAGSGMVAPS